MKTFELLTLRNSRERILLESAQAPSGTYSYKTGHGGGSGLDLCLLFTSAAYLMRDVKSAKASGVLAELFNAGELDHTEPCEECRSEFRESSDKSKGSDHIHRVFCSLYRAQE